MTATTVDPCPACKTEWGRDHSRHCHNIRRWIHKKSIVLAPGTPLSEALAAFKVRHYRESCSQMEGCDNAGEPSPFPYILGDIDHAIGMLKRYRAEVQALSTHAHEWNLDDYCNVCGADGRA